jgi:hypothetical protein
MRSPMRAAVGCLAACAFTLGASLRADAESPEEASGDQQGVYEKGVVEVEPADAPFSFVAVDNRLGDVRVEGHDGTEIIIHSFKRGPDDAALDRLKVSLVPDPAGPIRIDTRLDTALESQPLPAGSVRIDLLIRAPRSAGVRAEVWNGRLGVANMEGGAELRVNDGEIEVEHCSGRIIAQTAKGAQRFKEVVGDIEAQGLRSDMDLRVIRGERLDAAVYEGTVVAHNIRARHVSIGVTRGGVSFHGEVLLGGSYRIATYSGNVEVKLAEGSPVTVRGRARKGEVKLPAAMKPATRRGGWVTGHYRLGKSSAAPVMQLATNVGNIQVRF